MINWEKELERIFEDPLLADVVAPRKRTTSSDRLIAGFQEILDFYEKNGRLPELREERDRYAGGKDTAGESGHTGQFCHAGGDRPVHGAEIHDGRTAVPPGAGIEASRYPS